MNNFNLVILEGRLTKDPEIKYTQNGTALCKFSIANNSAYYRNDELQEEVTFVEVTTWSKLAEQCGEYLKKGRRVIVNGRLKQNRWNDSEGSSHSKITLVGNRVHFLDTKRELEKNTESELSDGEIF